MSKEKPAYSFNQDYLKRVKKDAFIKAHAHLDERIPLAEIWEKANPQKEKPEPKEEK
jgi:hypothetical protein